MRRFLSKSLFIGYAPGRSYKLVRIVGFEPTTTHFQGECANQTALYPVEIGAVDRARTCNILLGRKALLPIELLPLLKLELDVRFELTKLSQWFTKPSPLATWVIQHKNWSVIWDSSPFNNLGKVICSHHIHNAWRKK